jgi:adenylate kinase
MDPETSMPRQLPVIIITGTPGTGKSTHAELLTDVSPIPLTHINVSEWVKEKGFQESYDVEWQSFTVDEDRVSLVLFQDGDGSSDLYSRQLLDELEPLACEGGIILDWHTCDIFPERWADLVVVLRCNHTLLWQRLEERCADPRTLGVSPNRQT